jgi:hypothetical protein
MFELCHNFKGSVSYVCAKFCHILWRRDNSIYLLFCVYASKSTCVIGSGVASLFIFFHRMYVIH